jgi:nucleotide-binding universal stress UspA family protein
MTKILIAADDTERAVRCAPAAHQLFGDGAYFVIHVADDPATSVMRWGSAVPVAMPLMLYSPAADVGDVWDAVHEAEDHAAQVAHRALLDEADPIGTTGDAVVAILRAAREHDVDVIVVGNHEHNWLSRLITGSVKNEILRKACRPVIVVRRDSPPGRPGPVPRGVGRRSVS